MVMAAESAGSAFLGFIFGLYFVIALLFSFYAWAKYTHRGEESIVRRLKAAGYGLAWPYFLFVFMNGRQEQEARAGEVDAAKRRILD